MKTATREIAQFAACSDTCPSGTPSKRKRPRPSVSLLGERGPLGVDHHVRPAIASPVVAPTTTPATVPLPGTMRGTRDEASATAPC